MAAADGYGHNPAGKVAAWTFSLIGFAGTLWFGALVVMEYYGYDYPYRR